MSNYRLKYVILALIILVVIPGAYVIFRISRPTKVSVYTPSKQQVKTQIDDMLVDMSRDPKMANDPNVVATLNNLYSRAR